MKAQILKRLELLAFCLLTGLVAGGAQSTEAPAETESPATVTEMPDTDPGIPPLPPQQGVWIDWQQRNIYAQGLGCGHEAQDMAVRQQLALRAARADALRKLAGLIHGIHLSPVQTVAQWGQQSEKHLLRIQGVIQGATESQLSQSAQPGCVQLRLLLPLKALEQPLHTPIPRQ